MNLIRVYILNFQIFGDDPVIVLAYLHYSLRIYICDGSLLKVVEVF